MVKTKDEQETQERVLRMDNDYLFKSLFRSVEARDMVAIVLSKITELDEEILLNADYIGGEHPKKKKNERAKTSDVIVKIDDNFRIIVELNASYYPNVYRKSASYAFANYIEYTPIGTDTKTTVYPNIVLVNIDVVKHFKTNDPVSIFEIRNKEGELEVDSYKSFHFIIENAAKKEYNKDEDLYQFALFMKAEDMDKYEKKEMKKYGLELGRAEGQKLVIQNMMNNGFKIPEISKMINIFEEEINNLLN